MSKPSINQEQLDQWCRLAVAPKTGSLLHHVDPEDLALLASRDLGAIAPERLPRLLDAVAGDPDLARLVADLASSGVMVRSADAPRGRRRGGLRLALVACGTIAFGLVAWRVVDPPGIASDDPTVTLMDGSHGDAHPVDVATARHGAWSTVDVIRDAVLLAVLGAMGILAWPALRDLDKPAVEASRRSVR